MHAVSDRIAAGLASSIRGRAARIARGTARIRGAQTARRRRRCRVAGADLYRLAGIADHAARAIVDRLGCPVAAGRVDRLGIALIDNIAGRPRGNNGACDDGAGDGTDDGAGPPNPILPATGRTRPLQSWSISLRSSQIRANRRASSSSEFPQAGGERAACCERRTNAMAPIGLFVNLLPTK